MRNPNQALQSQLWGLKLRLPQKNAKDYGRGVFWCFYAVMLAPTAIYFNTAPMWIIVPFSHPTPQRVTHQKTYLIVPSGSSVEIDRKEISWHDWVHKPVAESNKELNTKGIYRRCFRLVELWAENEGSLQTAADLYRQERCPSKVKAQVVSSPKGAVDNRRRSQRLSPEPQQGLYQE